MIVLWHSYQPITTDGKAVTGDTAWQAKLFERLARTNCHIETSWNAGLDRLQVNMVSGRYDLILFIWRWAMPTYPDRQAVFLRQNRLLDDAIKLNIPFLVYDLDHMMSIEDKARVWSNGGVIASPALYPADERTVWLPLPSPYSTIYTEEERAINLMYVGNNYERYAQAKKYLGPLNVSMYGNWLIPNPDRESPETVIEDFPNARFPGRLNPDLVIPKLSNTYATIHLAKPSYCRTGFMTIRYAEALTAGCVGFIPEEFRLPIEFSDLLVGTASGLEAKTKRVSFDFAYRWELLSLGARLVERYMSWRSWLPTLRKVANRKY